MFGVGELWVLRSFEFCCVLLGVRCDYDWCKLGIWVLADFQVVLFWGVWRLLKPCLGGGFGVLVLGFSGFCNCWFHGFLGFLALRGLAAACLIGWF